MIMTIEEVKKRLKVGDMIKWHSGITGIVTEIDESYLTVHWIDVQTYLPISKYCWKHLRGINFVEIW